MMEVIVRITHTIMDITEMSCFLSLFQMQPMNEISYHKVTTSIKIYSDCNRVGASKTGLGVPMNGVPMVWKHPGGFHVGNFMPGRPLVLPQHGGFHASYGNYC